MPTTTYMVVDPRHDHSLRVPRPDLSVQLGDAERLQRLPRADKRAQWAADAIRAWYGHRPEGLQRYATAFSHAERGSADAGPELVAVARDVGQPAFARASALQALGRFPSRNASGVALQSAGNSDPLLRRASIAALSNAPPAERWTALAPLLADPIRSVRLDAVVALADVPASRSDAAFRAQRASTKLLALHRGSS